MWSHYADSHKGIVLEFESKEPGLYDWVKTVLEESFYPSQKQGSYLGGPDEG